MPANLLGLRDNPFAAGHDPQLIFDAEPRAEVVSKFRSALGSGEPFILLTGEAGVGKTSVVTQALAEEKAWSALITNPLLTRAELLEEICLRFGVDLPESVSKPRLLAELERHLTEIRREDGAPVLVVDEAHDLSLELLEELRLLSNLEFQGKPLVQIVLVGLPALEARLAQQDLAQLRQRISAHARMQPLDAEATWRYIHYRVAAAGGDGAERFPDETCLEIYRLTRGVPRAINTLAGHALVAASRESERVVTVKHVQAEAADTWLRNVSDGAPPTSGRSTPKPTGEPRVAKPEVPQRVPEASPGAEPASAPPPGKAASPRATEADPAPDPASKAAPANPEPRKKKASRAPEPVEPPKELPTPPRVSGEAEVKEWISRFVDPDNPIQIGIHAGDSGPFLPTEMEEAGEGEPGPEGAVEPSRPERRRSPALPRLRRGRNDLTWITAGALAVLAIAAAVVLVPRMKPHAAAPADSAAVAAAPQASRSPGTSSSRSSSARASAQSGAASSRRAAASDSAAARHRWQGIEVASYLDPYRASSESARLSELTGLSSRVVETNDKDGDAYRVVLGSFGTHKKAERAADDLISRGVIEQARVVPLGPKRR